MWFNLGAVRERLLFLSPAFYWRLNTVCLTSPALQLVSSLLWFFLFQFYTLLGSSCVTKLNVFPFFFFQILINYLWFRAEKWCL